ncbi:Hpt domain-containing protein [Pedobacter puniceum]|uniref:Hpt domain-containing protein n=1 Tax=Pedobacter puniceum TaxID=2666136 RepID=A0A7K0FL90_9SPHI|nr:Hpt domain-containing protein [Pedobacter puniceum]MRX46010.1 Hpt domain-containing protein [Pedobacter puniceum]
MDHNQIIIDLSYLREVASENIEFMVEMIDIFLDQTPGYLSNLSDAIENKNWQKIAESAHKIKPTLGFMGIESARETMAEIELNARKQEDFENIVLKYNQMQEVFKTIFIKLEEKKQELLAQDN